MKKPYIAITIGIMCFLLVIGICIQLKTIESTGSVSKSLSDNALRDEVLKWKERYDNAYRELQQAENRLENERKKASTSDEETVKMEEELHKINVLLGLTDVVGRGVVVTVDDSKLESSQILDANSAVVHDGDLVEIVNILKNGGAEAVSINNQRIINTTAITCDGTVVRINGEKIGVPFVINAIGPTEGLKGSLEMKNNYVSQMIEDGVEVKIVKSNKVEIPKYNGVIESEYMKDR